MIKFNNINKNYYKNNNNNKTKIIDNITKILKYKIF